MGFSWVWFKMRNTFWGKTLYTPPTCEWNVYVCSILLTVLSPNRCGTWVCVCVFIFLRQARRLAKKNSQHLWQKAVLNSAGCAFSLRRLPSGETTSTRCAVEEKQSEPPEDPWPIAWGSIWSIALRTYVTHDACVKKLVPQGIKGQVF